MVSKIYHMHPLVAGPLPAWPRHLASARAMGFNYVGSAPLFAPGRCGDIYLSGDHETLHPALEASTGADHAIASLVDECARHDLGLVVDLVIDRVAADAVIRTQQPAWFDAANGHGGDSPDPRQPPRGRGLALARFDQPSVAASLVQWWVERLVRLAQAGVAGFRCLMVDHVPAAVWQQIISGVHAAAPQCKFIAWTPGIALDDLRRLIGVGFDQAASSIAWWDMRASWLVEEAEALRQIAPSIASPEPSFRDRLAVRLDPQVDVKIAYRRALRLAAATASGIFVPMGFEYATRHAFDPVRAAPKDFDNIQQDALWDLRDEVAYANALVDQVAAEHVDGEMRTLTGPGGKVTTLLRTDAPDVREARRAIVVMVNPDLSRSAAGIKLQPLPPEAGAAFVAPRLVSSQADAGTPLVAGEVRVITYQRAADIIEPISDHRSVEDAATAPRIAIEAITPAVDGGAFPVKSVLGQSVVVQADIFGDGHEVLAADLLWRGVDASEWQRTPMRLWENDRWQATFVPQRVGRHLFTVEAWRDEWGTFRRDVKRKREANLDVTVEIEEARKLLLGIAPATLLDTLAASSIDNQVVQLLSEELSVTVSEAGHRPFTVRHEPPIPLDADRPQAAFASWYELFPRSATTSPERHGKFADVIDRLPAIRAMGFDVIYFPPIHPIGTTNRKGRNNKLQALPDDVGSPYAIGNPDGGHDAIHPALGTLDDFRGLIAAARELGLEVALDYAIQCSLDHPWLKQHPAWFRWRPDGTVQYAENPPKKYEDIVNVDFYAKDAVPELWLALRDIVQFWIDQGVHIFRVDNPHTKPLPFWQWMIADIRSRAPDTIFLAEAFTRPKMMNRLAKIGFTQSYTYFTWRNTKQEITEYLTELNSAPVSDFFRPNFFVNTPDINPLFLQSSGRAGFLIRAALAATLSGLWGMYSGFELCEAAPLPGREEYLDSEKYEIRPRDYTAAGNIVAEIAALNRIRRAQPALHSHLGLRFYNAFNDQVLFYGKVAAQQNDMILIAISLDPHQVQTAAIEIPLWEWGLPDDGALAVEDLVRNRRFVWQGKSQQIRLDPADLPFAIWRVAPLGAE